MSFQFSDSHVLNRGRRVGVSPQNALLRWRTDCVPSCYPIRAARVTEGYRGRGRSRRPVLTWRLMRIAQRVR